MARDLKQVVLKDEIIDKNNINQCMKDFIGKTNVEVTLIILLKALAKALDYWDDKK